MCDDKKETMLRGNLAVEFSRTLKIVGVDGHAWETLYYCFDSDTYWLKTYPHSELQGGGEPILTKIDDLEIISRFRSS